jgi:hypothetical protein
VLNIVSNTKTAIESSWIKSQQDIRSVRFADACAEAFCTALPAKKLAPLWYYDTIEMIF